MFRMTPATPRYDRHAETARAAALQALALLGTAPEREFDALVALAAELLGCSTALLNLVDNDRLFVKARTTPGAMTFDRATAFCDRTVVDDCLTVIDDTLCDERFRHSPLVTDVGVRFYAGAPLRVADPDGVRRADRRCAERCRRRTACRPRGGRHPDRRLAAAHRRRSGRRRR